MKKRQAWEQYLATLITDRSYGGLLVCDIRSDIDSSVGGLLDGTDLSPAPYFTHLNNQGFYQSTLMDWFRFWGYSLSSQTPGELGRAITYLKIHSATIDSRHWISTLRAITDAVEYLDASGVIFTSSLPFVRVVRKPRYPKVVHGLLFDKGTRWVEINSGNLNLYLADANDVKLMSCAHPRDEVPYSHVVMSANVMNEWLNAVMVRYRIRQTGTKDTNVFDDHQPMMKKSWPRTLHVMNNKPGHT